MFSSRWWADCECWGNEGCWPVAGTQGAGAPPDSLGHRVVGGLMLITWTPPTGSVWVEVAEAWPELSWEDLGHFCGSMMGLRVVGGDSFYVTTM